MRWIGATVAVAFGLLGCARETMPVAVSDGSTSHGSSTTSGETRLDGSTSTSADACGNGVLDPGEHCDSSDVWGVPCPSSCAFEPQTLLGEWALALGCRVRLALDDGGVLVESGDRLQKWSRDGALAWESETEVVGLLEVAAVGEDVFAVGVDQQARTWFTRLGPDGANLATVVDLEQDGWPGGGVFGLVPWTDGRLALFVQGTADQIGIAGVVVLRPDGSAVETRELVIADVQFGEPGPFSSWGLSAPDIGAGLDPGQFIIGGAFSHVADGVGFSGPFLQSRDTFETVRWEVPPSATATANAFFDDIEVGPDGTVVAREWSGGLHAYDGDGQRRWSESKRVEGSDAAVLPDGDVVQHYLDYRPLDDGTFTNFTATRRFGPQGELVWRMEREGSRPGSLLVTHDGDLVGCYVDDATEEARLYAMVP